MAMVQWCRETLVFTKKCVTTESALNFLNDLGGVSEADLEVIADVLVTYQFHLLLEGRQDALSCIPKDFDTESVPEGLFWRKNNGRNWDRQCLEDRFGWFSDSHSIRQLLQAVKENGVADVFLESIGFTKPYGTLYFMFFTQRQIEWLCATQGVIFFRPTWAEFLPHVKKKIESQDVFYGFAKSSWLSALTALQHTVINTGDLRGHFEWSRKNKSDAECPDPATKPVPAVRFMLDKDYGANHLFMGDGFTYSEDGVKGQAEYLGSSFLNFNLTRTLIPSTPSI